MMSKILLLCFLFLSMPVCSEAWDFFDASDLFLIKIRNTLYTDCQLQDKSILFGHVDDHSQIPNIIPAFQTKSFIMRPGPRYRIYGNDESILITYTCGVDQSITLYTTNNDLMDERTFDENNMHARFETNWSPMLISVYSEILWTLEY